MSLYNYSKSILPTATTRQFISLFAVVWAVLTICLLWPIGLMLSSAWLYQYVLFPLPEQVEMALIKELFAWISGSVVLSPQLQVREISHLQDVAAVRLGVLWMLGLAGVTLFWLRHAMVAIAAQVYVFLKYIGAVTVVGGVLIGVWFETVFVWVHYILFPFGNWQFAADSQLIQLVPFDIFVRAVVIWFGLGMMTYILVLVGVRSLVKK